MLSSKAPFWIDRVNPHQPSRRQEAAATAIRCVSRWQHLHQELLRKLNAAGQLDWSRGIVDSSQIRALRGGLTGPSPVDRSRAGSKHHLITDGNGIPLAVTLTGANRNDVTQLLPRL